MQPAPQQGPQPIENAAFLLFSERGYAATTVRAVAAAAGVSPGVVTYYFPKKSDLYRGALLGPYQRFVANLERVVGEAGSSPRQRLLAVLNYGADPGDEAVRLLRTLLRQALESAVPLEGMVEPFAAGHVRLLMGVLGDAVAAGVLPPYMGPSIAPILLGGILLPRLLRESMRSSPQAAAIFEVVAGHTKETLFKLLGLV